LYAFLRSYQDGKTSSDEITIPSEIADKDDADPFAGLKIYPNPTPGIFTIEMDNQVYSELKIKIFTQEGNPVLNIDDEKISEHFSSQIDLNRQGNGIYLINLQSDKHSVIRKIILN
jgi:hypothetical protein